jgi:hypothetical protein
MTFNINDLNSAISGNNGLLYATHFSVMVTAPKCSQGNSQIIQQIPMFCHATDLPGLQFDGEQVRPSGFGLFETRPLTAAFAPVQFTFYCDGNGALLKFFQTWLQNVQNFNVNQRQSSTVNGAGLGVFNYPDWYETTIEITLYNPIGDEVLKYTLDRAWPMMAVPQALSWEAEQHDILRFTVQFAYRAWTTEAIGQGSGAG